MTKYSTTKARADIARLTELVKAQNEMLTEVKAISDRLGRSADIHPARIREAWDKDWISHTWASMKSRLMDAVKRRAAKNKALKLLTPEQARALGIHA